MQDLPLIPGEVIYGDDPVIINAGKDVDHPDELPTQPIVRFRSALTTTSRKSTRPLDSTARRPGDGG